jgi:hypothetical protein
VHLAALLGPELSQGLCRNNLGYRPIIMNSWWAFLGLEPFERRPLVPEFCPADFPSKNQPPQSLQFETPSTQLTSCLPSSHFPNSRAVVPSDVLRVTWCPPHLNSYSTGPRRRHFCTIIFCERWPHNQRGRYLHQLVQLEQ